MSLVLADITSKQLTDACGEDPDWLCREVFERTEDETLADIADFVLGTPLAIAAIALGAFVLNRLVGRAIERGMRSLTSGVVRERVGAARRRAPGNLLGPSDVSLRAAQRISALTTVLRSVAGFVIVLFATFAVLSELGVDVAPLLAGAGVVGVALGFGSQSLVKDFLSGMFILVEDQFGVGDLVELDGSTSGTVEAVSLRTTRLRAEDGTVWHVPNGAIIRVGNKSQGRGPAGGAPSAEPEMPGEARAPVAPESPREPRRPVAPAESPARAAEPEASAEARSRAAEPEPPREAATPADTVPRPSAEPPKPKPRPPRTD